MSVLINMEMPTSCCACPLFKSNMSKQLFCKAFGAFDKSDYDKLPIERMKNCPLVPAADVRPVVRGKWLNDFCGKGRFSKRIVQCSLCGNFLDLDGVNAGRGDANYCPNCGADMREPPKEE